jgi:hypothetical protein
MSELSLAVMIVIYDPCRGRRDRHLELIVDRGRPNPVAAWKSMSIAWAKICDAIIRSGIPESVNIRGCVT